MLGLGTKLTGGRLPMASHVTDNLKMLHRYNTGSVVPLSDGAAYFDGDNSQITSSLPGSTFDGDFSTAFWVKRIEIGGTDVLLHIKDGTSDNVYVAFTSDNKVKLQLMDTYTDTAAESEFSNVGIWNHIVCVQNDAENTQQIYLNGVDVATDATSARDIDVDVDATNFTLGSNVDKTTDEFKGYMCNVGVWSRALTQPEVKSIMWKQYADLSSTETTSLVAWYNLDSVDGSTVADSTGNYNGTLE